MIVIGYQSLPVAAFSSLKAQLPVQGLEGVSFSISAALLWEPGVLLKSI